jgi:hypothetical protein
MYIYMHIRIYTYIYTNLHIYIYIYLYVYIYFRELNNNPAHGKFATTVGKEKSRLIIEFCLENVRKVEFV